MDEETQKSSSSQSTVETASSSSELTNSPGKLRQTSLDEWLERRKLKKSETFILRKKRKIFVKRLSPEGTIPSRKTEGAAGFDLTSPIPLFLPPFASCSVGLKIAIEIPKGFCGKILPRSGLAKSHKITILGGLIDSDFRGEIEVMLMNLGQSPLDLPANSRIAQMTVEPVNIEEQMTEVKELTKTLRNQGGFGSTGITS